MSKPFDVIVFGASGFTGRLVAEYLSATYGVGGELIWAMAGRNVGKLGQVRDLIGAPKQLPLIVANAADPASLESVARSTRAIITTVGPYQLYGEPLLAACASEGCDYVDLCGEPGWMAQMIAKYDSRAKGSGARIVFSCGFDSIPFDLGVLFLQSEARQRFGAPALRVRARVRKLKGTASGGTIASMLATFEAMGRDPALAAAMADPFALTPGFKGPAQPKGDAALYDAAAKSWAGPFIMAPINTKNVHRTNALAGHAYGREFVYDEMMLTGGGARGQARAKAMVRMNQFQTALLGFAPTRALLRRFALPKPGQGPDKTARETGHYDLLFIGEAQDGRTLRVSVKGDRDPGYGSTCKLIAETALCMVRDVGRDATGGGIWTPAAALGTALIERLQARAGLKFAVED